MYTLVSPWPPQRNGIADYAFEIARWTTTPLQVVTEADPPTRPATGRIRFAAPDRFDPALPMIYHIGNNPDHAFLVRMFLERPGVAVLHDLSLQYLAEQVEDVLPGFFAHQLRASHPGDLGLLERVWAHRGLKRLVDYDEVPLLDWLSDARALVVHSRHAAHLARARLPNVPIHVVPAFTYLPELGFETLEALRRSERPRWTDDGSGQLLVIAVLGFPRRYKLCGAVFEAIALLPERVRSRMLVLIGCEAHSPDYDVLAEAARFDLGCCVRTLGYLSPRDLSGVMLAADLVVNLRYPSFGETSGILSRALGLGCAVAVTRTGAYAELPDEVCFKVPPRENPSHALRALFQVLMDDRAPIIVRRQAAYDYAHVVGNPARAARRYVEIARG
jgi:hypothetical protein